MQTLGSKRLKRCFAALLTACAVGVVAAPPTSATFYGFCGGVVQPLQTCSGPRHTLTFIEVYTPYSNSTVSEYAKDLNDGGYPQHERFGTGDVTSGNDFNNNGALLTPHGDNKDTGAAHTLKAYELT